jgi:hypothetical protein
MNIWLAMLLMASMLTIPIFWAISITYSIHISKKHLTEMTASIKSSPELSSTIELYSAMGVFRKILIPGLLHSAISKSRFASIGLISHHDAENFPAHLRKILARDNLLHRISLIWTTGVFLILTIRNLPELSTSGVLQYFGIHSFRHITDLTKWSNGLWLFVISLGFAMLFATLWVTDKLEKTHHKEIFEHAHLKTKLRSNKRKTLLPDNVGKWMTLESLLITFCVAWIAISIALKEYFSGR